MERTVRLGLSWVTLLGHIAFALSLTCHPTDVTLPPNSCLLLQGSPLASWVDSSDQCTQDGYTDLAVISDLQLDNLVNYAQGLGKEGMFYWLGYTYDEDPSTLLDTSMRNASSALLNEGNFGTTGGAAAGVCIAMGADGLLYRRQCSELLGSFCQLVLEAPSANASVSGGRFVAAGASVTLECATSGSDVEVTWLAFLPSSSPPVLISEEASVTIPSFMADDAGAYYCIASNRLGSHVSTPVVLVLDSASTDTDIPVVSLSDGGLFQFGSPANFTCTSTIPQPTDTAQWFINGRPMNADGGGTTTPSVLSVEDLQEEGYYQCFVVTQNGGSAGVEIFVEAQPGTAGLIDQLMAEANSRQEIFVSWLCPEFINTHHEALLRYQILYHEGQEFMSGSAIPVDGLKPLLLNGSLSTNCVVEALVPNLSLGTRYVVKVVAMTSGTEGESAREYAVVTTFGSLPDPIQDIKVTRSPDSKEVLAQWGSVVTTPPVGVVLRYQIQYRDSQKGSVSTVIHSRVFNYVVILNVINANNYEVRVSSGVQRSRDPVEYEYSDFSDWAKVNGISTVLPSPVPTIGISTPPSIAIGPIAAGVVVGVLVFALVITILSVGMFCWVCRKKDPGPVDAVSGQKLGHDIPLNEEEKVLD